jgi:hypothetical protein
MAQYAAILTSPTESEGFWDAYSQTARSRRLLFVNGADPSTFFEGGLSKSRAARTSS